MENIQRFLKIKTACNRINIRLAKDASNVLVELFKKRQASGQASVEFVLVLPFLIIIILIVFQLGYLVYLQNIVEHAAREGARIITTTNSDNEAHKSAYSILKKMDDDKIEINIQPSAENQRKTGDIVRIEIRYTYSGMAKIIRLLTGRDVVIKSNCSMRMECGDG